MNASLTPGQTNRNSLGKYLLSTWFGVLLGICWQYGVQCGQPEHGSPSLLAWVWPWRSATASHNNAGWLRTCVPCSPSFLTWQSMHWYGVFDVCLLLYWVCFWGWRITFTRIVSWNRSKWWNSSSNINRCDLLHLRKPPDFPVPLVVCGCDSQVAKALWRTASGFSWNQREQWKYVCCGRCSGARAIDSLAQTRGWEASDASVGRWWRSPSELLLVDDYRRSGRWTVFFGSPSSFHSEIGLRPRSKKYDNA